MKKILEKIMKSYTDLGQSKVLAEILPLESADMYYEPAVGFRTEPSEPRFGDIKYAHPRSIRCWSLAALLGVLKERDDCNALVIFTNKAQLYTITTSYYKDASWKNISIISDSLVNACYDMIIKLNELNVL